VANLGNEGLKINTGDVSCQGKLLAGANGDGRRIALEGNVYMYDMMSIDDKAL